MKREIVTHHIDSSQMKEELAFLTEYFIGKGFEACELLFGSAWGMDYYDTNQWDYEKVPLTKLVEKVEAVEASGLGHLGSDDLFIKLQGYPFEFRFCHESDLHISFDEPGDIPEFFYERWKSRGFSPAEWPV